MHDKATRRPPPVPPGSTASATREHQEATREAPQRIINPRGGLINQQLSAIVVPVVPLLVPCWGCPGALAVPALRQPRGRARAQVLASETPTGGMAPLGSSDTRSHFCGKHRDPFKPPASV